MATTVPCASDRPRRKCSAASMRARPDGCAPEADLRADRADLAGVAHQRGIQKAARRHQQAAVLNGRSPHQQRRHRRVAVHRDRHLIADAALIQRHLRPGRQAEAAHIDGRMTPPVTGGVEQRNLQRCRQQPAVDAGHVARHHPVGRL
ncbi:MAG TPA: hypothetical protein PKA20_06920, partial [Burkholderiaceae bacterium]|nr:hypothetical protein [Burkholderiaceae bacterium]